LIVAPQSPWLPSLPCFIDEGLSVRRSENNPKALADAVLAQLAAWKAGERNVELIAEIREKRTSSRAVV
jgi:hypothetical protein